MSLENSAKLIIEKCLAVKPNEKVLIITDSGLVHIAEILLKAVEEITTGKLIEIPVGKVSGEEPPANVVAMMKHFNVIIMPTTKSLSWTKARKDACLSGARIASMPGITEETFSRAVDVDYDEMKERTLTIANLLENGSEIRITTFAGTDIRASIKDRKSHGRSSGIYDMPGKWGNIPSGEAFIAPVEGTANGVFVVDASMSGIGKLNGPIKITVKKGMAVDISSDELSQILASVNNKNAYNIAEIGIGTNNHARICGSVLEDEKVMGTAHIALGKNSDFGGTVDVGIHLDGVFRNPTIFIDGKKIIENGEFLV